MMKHEFEKLAGYEVSIEDYVNIIDPMYMATGLNQKEFVQTINKKRFALKTRKQLVNEMKKIAAHLRDTCDHYTDYDAKDELENKIEEYIGRFYSNNISWRTNLGYTGHEYGRGCSFPTDVVLFHSESGKNIERFQLV